MSDLPSDTEGGTGRFGASIVIERPIGEAFASTTDLNNHHIWDSAVRSSAQTSAGPMGMDTTFQWTVQLLAKSFTFEFETTAYEPNRRFAYQSTSGPFSARSEWAYEAANGGTRFSWVAEGKPGARGLLRPPHRPARRARARSGSRELAKAAGRTGGQGACAVRTTGFTAATPTGGAVKNRVS